LSYFVLGISSIAIFYIALFNVCKIKFSVVEKIVAPIATYLLFLSVLFLSLYVFTDLNIDIFGNITVTASLALFVYIKSKNWLLSGYYAVFAAIITMISSSIISAAMDMVFNVYVYESRDNAIAYYATVALTIPTCFVLSLYLGNYVNKSFSLLNEEVKNKFAKYGLILSALTYVLSHINFLVSQLSVERAFLASLNAIVIITIFFTSILVIAAYALAQQKQMESELKSKAQEDLESYTKKLESAYEDMRHFRHDHLNMLYGLTGYIENNNQPGFKEYLEQNLVSAKDSLDALDKAMVQLKYIHIPELKGLLSVKLAQAQARGIELALDIDIPVKEIAIERTELCRMVGIMLDNAVEELLIQDYPNKNLSFGIIIDENDVLIICANTCTTSPPIEEIFSKGYTSKGIGRGLGLYNLKQTCKKRGNILLSAHVENDVFTIIATIMNSEGQSHL
jgi:two-component system sensor histidine kinase AgrC